MSAAPAYDLPYFQPAPARPSAPRPSAPLRPDVRFAANPDAETGTSPVVLVARITAAVLVLVAALCMARLALTSATVATAIENQGIESQIDTARTEGSSLEIDQSKLSAPTRIKNEAKSMGMAAPSSAMMIDLSGDVVVTDQQGNLSLSGSVAAVAQNA